MNQLLWLQCCIATNITSHSDAESPPLTHSVFLHAGCGHRAPRPFQRELETNAKASTLDGILFSDRETGPSPMKNRKPKPDECIDRQNHNMGRDHLQQKLVENWFQRFGQFWGGVHFSSCSLTSK